MRSFSLASLALVLGAAISLASCENKQSAPATENTTQSSSDSSAATNNSESEGTTGSEAIPDTKYKRYALNKAHIKYEVSGFRRGIEELYFDNWGLRESRHINVEILTEQGVRPDKTIIVTNGSHMMMANLMLKRGNTMTEPSVDSLMHAPNVDPPEVISDTILSRMHYVRQGTATVLDKPTTIWMDQNSGTKLYTWRGIVLKQEVTNPEFKQTVVAVSIDTTQAIPDSVFVAPKTVEYSPVPARPKGY